MKFILGIKEEMTQVFSDDGSIVPVTIVDAGTVIITQIKSDEKEGYNSVQVGFGEKSKKNTNKAEAGHNKDLGNFRYLKEFKMEDTGEMKVGDKIESSSFEAGDNVQISGITKGKGFQGVVKRHGFHGGPRTHGQKHTERAPGSIGATGPQRVFKGTKMGGRMGSDRVTVKNLRIVAIDKENNKILVSGAVPGRRGTLLEIVSK